MAPGVVLDWDSWISRSLGGFESNTKENAELGSSPTVGSNDGDGDGAVVVDEDEDDDAVVVVDDDIDDEDEGSAVDSEC